MKRWFTFIFPLITLVLVILLFTGFRASANDKSFPIPLSSILVKTYKDGDAAKDTRQYVWVGSDNRYFTAIKQHGWKMIDQEGSERLFKKGNKEISLVKMNHGFLIETIHTKS